MKLRFITIIIIITIITVILPSAALAATLSLAPSSGTFNKSCNFSLDIELDTAGASTDGTDTILFYDTSRLTASSISTGSLYGDYPGNNIDSGSGKIIISGIASVSSPYSGKGVFATVQFSVKDSAPTGATQIKFDFDPQDRSKTTDSNVVERGTVSDVLTSVTNGSFIVGSGTCAAISPTPRPEGQVIISTPSARPTYPTPAALPSAGTEELTFTIAIVGAVLTFLGILGLAIL